MSDEFKDVLDVANKEDLKGLEHYTDNLDQFEITVYFLRSLLKRSNMDELLRARPDIRKRYQSQFHELSNDKSIEALDFTKSMMVDPSSNTNPMVIEDKFHHRSQMNLTPGPIITDDAEKSRNDRVLPKSSSVDNLHFNEILNTVGSVT